MFTRCPACHTVHPLNAAVLTQGRGKYRCSKCNKVANALLALFDDWPKPGQQPSPIGDIPILGLSIDLEQAGKSRLNPEDGGLTGEEKDTPSRKRSGSPWLRALWIGGALVLAVAIVFKWAEFEGQPIQEQPAVQDALIKMGLREAPPKEVFRDLSLIHLVSRELTENPVQPGKLRLSATIVNRAPREQPYPDLEVILLDAAGEPVASHRFGPEDYLASFAAGKSRMSPQAYLPLTLDLEDPGAQAVGFELNFR
jgi:predicted Zn finger-like uncharacterized protein